MDRSPATTRSGATGALLLSLLLLGGCTGDDQAPDTHRGVDSVSSLRTALRADPDSVDLRLRLGRLYLGKGDGAAAESHLLRAIEVGANDPRAPGDYVRSLLMQGKHFEALEAIEPLVADAWAASARIWMLRGEAQLGQTNFDRRKIRDSFMQAFRQMPDEDDDETAQRLAVLADTQAVAAAARDHVQCRGNAVSNIEPPPPTDPPDGARVLRVGPERELKTPSQAARVAQDGDVVEIDAGVYRGDVAVWTQDRLILRGVGGMAELEAAGRHAEGKGIWVFDGDDITAENIAFSGAKVPHRNGAGIRLQGKGATIRNCQFRDNENGILGGSAAGPVPGNDVLVEFSTFERNGSGDGLTHNIYVGKVNRFTMRYSYSFAANKGHLVKSRAQETAILFSRLVVGEDGDSSYVINVPDGGKAWVVGNELQQGPLTDNPAMISFAEESSDREDQALIVVNNTFYNKRLDSIFVRNRSSASAIVANNLFAGAPAVMLDGPGEDMTNVRRPGPWFEDAQAYDFRLTQAAPAIDAGTDPADIAGLPFMPDAEYRHPAAGQSRQSIATIDVGAREFCGL